MVSPSFRWSGEDLAWKWVRLYVCALDVDRCDVEPKARCYGKKYPDGIEMSFARVLADVFLFLVVFPVRNHAKFQLQPSFFAVCLDLEELMRRDEVGSKRYIFDVHFLGAFVLIVLSLCLDRLVNQPLGRALELEVSQGFVAEN